MGFSLKRSEHTKEPEPGLRVLYDGGCDLCTRSVKILRGLDFEHDLAYLDLEDEGQAAQMPGVSREDALAALHVVDGKGELYRGFFACRRLARELPALWPLLPFFHAPLARRIGPRAYNVIARRRTRRGCRLAVESSPERRP
jgi:predicted DCC family thiol-disulfide oxidoreductase YuxK